MAIAYVQQASGTTSASVALGTAFGTFASNVTAGNLIVVAPGFNVGTAGTVSSITDTQGNTYTRIGGTTFSTTNNIALYYAQNITGGTNIVKFVGSVTTTVNFGFMAYEYSGIATSSALDKSAFGTTKSNAISGLGTTTATATTTAANELLFAAFEMSTNSTGTVGSGWGDGGTAVISNSGIFVEDKIVSATGAYAGTFSTGGAIFLATGIATFKQAAGGAGTNLIQSSGTAVLGLGSTSVVWSANTTTGNLIVVGVNLTNAAALGTVSSITDSQNNTYTRAIRGTISTLGDVLNAEIWYATNISGGAGSVTVNHTVDNCAMFAREYSGFNTLDVTNAANGSSTTPNSGTVTTNFATELLVVTTGDDNGSGQTWTAAGNFGDMVGTATTITGLSMEDNIVSSSGAQTGTLTFGNAANWEALMATFYNLTVSSGPGYKSLLGVGQI